MSKDKREGNVCSDQTHSLDGSSCVSPRKRHVDQLGAHYRRLAPFMEGRDRRQSGTQLATGTFLPPSHLANF